VGRVVHSYPAAGAAIVELSAELARGDTIHVRGQTSDFVQRVESLKRRGRRVERAKAGQQIGLAVEQRARVGDRVYRVVW
jgi:putative protease